MLNDLIGLSRKNQRADSMTSGLCIVFIVCLATIVAHDLALPRKALFTHAGGDFHAFYCAGEAASRGRNPYLVEPIGTCERQGSGSDSLGARDAVDPAPLPGYAIALFAILAHLPYLLAKGLWFFALVGSVFVGTWFLVRLTGLPALLVLLALSLTDGYINFIYGQLPPLIMASVAATAYYVERQKWTLAAGLGATAMLEPHVGVVICSSLFLFMPRTRAGLGVAAIGLAIASLFALDPATNVAYFTRVLPAQAAAELIAVDQWSLSHVLHVLGLADVWALRLGSVSYLVMFAGGLILARRAATALESPSIFVVLPPAAVLLGGAYMHELQLAIALPAAFILAARAERFRIAFGVALMLLVFPWFSLDASRVTLATTAATVAIFACIWIAIAIEIRGYEHRVRLSGTIASAFVVLFAGIALLPGPSHAVPPAANRTIGMRALRGDALASENWAAHLRARDDLSVATPRKEIEKLPSWIALTIVLAGSLSQRLVRRPLRRLGPIAA
ncbi:MAG: hypothetical protein NVS1B2_25180 [Vulcanimicrobiaceae bacterium]